MTDLTMETSYTEESMEDQPEARTRRRPLATGDGFESSPYPTTGPREQALLISVDAHRDSWDVRDSLEELARLAESVDVEVVGSVIQRLPHPIASTYVGKGKLEEIKTLLDELHCNLVLVDDELTPAQLRNLEKTLDVKIIDRTALILDVFARRAQTHEGRLQVELAQLEYRLPRLTRMWTHLSRQSVGGVGVRGPGETQLEVDRREAGKRISAIKAELAEVHRHRDLYRQHRRDQQAPVVAIVGYTNAGKSTLLNRLTGAHVLSENKLFATLDPTTRRLPLPGGREALLTDTVGFINNLPTMVIAAFRATLEEINEATVLLHVVDITHPNAAEQTRTVNAVLEELGADGKPTVMALNKIDLLTAGEGGPRIEDLQAELDVPVDVVAISAQSGLGLDHLLQAIQKLLESEQRFISVVLTAPYGRGELVDRFHRLGRVEGSSFDDYGTTLVGMLPESQIGMFAPFLSLRVDADQREPAIVSSAPESAA